MVSRNNNLRKSDLKLLLCLLGVLFDIDNRPADRVEERSIFFFRRERDAGRRVERANLTLRASGNSLYPGRKVERLLERRGVIGSSRGSSKLWNAIMSRHFCHRQRSIIE